MWPKIRSNLIFFSVVFLLIVIANYFIKCDSEAYISGIDNHRTVVIGTTTRCSSYLRASGHKLNYTYNFKGKKYTGYSHFKEKPAEEICKGVRFLVEVDSTKPSHSYLLLDSMVSN